MVLAMSDVDDERYAAATRTAALRIRQALSWLQELRFLESRNLYCINLPAQQENM